MAQSTTRCAACKYLRRRCSEDCIFAPYFPSNNPQRFSSVHKIFGASNVAKMLQQLPVHLRADAAECMSFEANTRIRDGVYGCVGIITQLQYQIIQAQQELAKMRGEIAYYNAQRQQLEDHLKMLEQSCDFHANPSWLITQTQLQQQTPSSINPGFTNSMRGDQFDGSIWQPNVRF